MAHIICAQSVNFVYILSHTFYLAISNTIYCVYTRIYIEKAATLSGCRFLNL